MLDFNDIVIWKSPPMVHFLWRSSQPNIRAMTYYIACPHFSVHFHTWKQQHIVNGLKLPLNLLTRVRDSNWNVPRFMAFKCKLSAYSKGVFPLGKWNPFVMLYEWGTYTSRMVSSNFAPKNMWNSENRNCDCSNYPIVSRKMKLGYMRLKLSFSKPDTCYFHN